MTSADVAIYAPRSTGMYERSPFRVGGAERQMALLARELAEQGKQVAHIVFPPDEPTVPADGRLTLVPRDPYAGAGGIQSRLREARSIWRSLAAADSQIYVLRGGSPAVGVAATYCRLKRRHLLFSSANDSDFTLETMSGRRHRSAIYRAGLESASAIVVQSHQQEDLARRVLRRVRRLERIPSFAQDVVLPSSAPAPEAFLWIGRLIDYKQPLRYLDLAREMPETRFWMLGIANESLAYAAQLRKQAATIPNLVLLDQRPHSETMDLVQRSIAVVSTSRLEGMPNVFLEAWSRGVPVLSLSFDPDGLLRDQGLGISAEGNWQRFVAAAGELATGRADRSGMADRARTYVHRTHGLQAVGERWIALVDELLAARPRPFGP